MSKMKYSRLRNSVSRLERKLNFATIQLVCAVLLACSSKYLVAQELTEVSPGESGSMGEVIHRVRCPWQSGETLVRVLVPPNAEENAHPKVLFVLPVEAGLENRYGDGLAEIHHHALHEKFGLICVAPTFSHLPWYADHPTETNIAQEAYLLKVVVPFIDQQYTPDLKPTDRILLGFSKSGWGAFSLLLRNPSVFGKAVAWDAPLMMDGPGKYGSGPIFATPENFQKYQLTELLRNRQQELGKEKRLFHFGIGNFQKEHEAFEQLLVSLSVPHGYAVGTIRNHHWNSGWVEEAIQMSVQSSDSLPK
jgi:hypothetical protein